MSWPLRSHFSTSLSQSGIIWRDVSNWKSLDPQKVFSTQMHLENWCCFECKLLFFFIGLFVKLKPAILSIDKHCQFTFSTQILCAVLHCGKERRKLLISRCSALENIKANLKTIIHAHVVRALKCMCVFVFPICVCFHRHQWIHLWRKDPKAFKCFSCGERKCSSCASSFAQRTSR